MTRKDYVLIAAAINEVRKSYDYIPVLEWQGSTECEAITNVAGAIAYQLAQDNPRFDRERFLRAAGVQS